MLVAAATCPHPPLLVPEATGAARPGTGGISTAGISAARRGNDSGQDGGHAVDAQIRALRAACREAVAMLAAVQPDLIAVVGGASRSALYEETAAGSLQRFGIPFATGNGDPVLPLSLTVGAWLIRGLPPGGPGSARPWRLHLQAVGHALPAGECLRIGAALACQAPRVALLVMGDGPARRATRAPGARDPLTDEYAAVVAAALAAADPARLAGLDPASDAELMVTGRPAWQVLAGAADGRRLRGRLAFAAAPLDVSYLVAVWEPI